MEKIYTELINKAKEASKDSYCPYSKFPVGACVLFESKKTYSGCNVENASYGLSLCAERNAISSAITQNEKTKIEAIAIYSPNKKLCMPCGACRQWLAEFCNNENELKIILENENQEISVYTLSEIFPCSFKF